MRRLSTFVAFGLAFGTACTTSTPVAEPEVTERPVSDLGVTGDFAEQLVGPAGAEIELGEATLRVPAGALRSDTMIRITIEDTDIPEGFRAYSPVYRIEPALSESVLELPHVGDDAIATLFWAQEDGGFAASSSEAEGGQVSASLTGVSRAFVGVACEGDECCRRATSALDVLLLLDNSGSMAEEQATLAAALPALVEALVTGDADGDGIQDFPVIDSLQLGSISSDIGTGGFTIPTCNEPNFGDDGLLLQHGIGAGCDPSYPAIQSFDGGDASAFASSVQCVAMTGTQGCGFEQSLDAMLKAVAPSTHASPTGSQTRFVNGSVGHGDGANAGLVREHATLALINLSDEDDCSALDPDIFNRDSATYTDPDLNLRCSRYADDALHPTSRYADGFLALKADPSQLVYAAIAGIPTGMGDATNTEILADPRMVEAPDPDMPSQLTPVCESEAGYAYPARRIVQVAEELEAAGAFTVASSICDSDFQAAAAAILASLASSASGSCE